MNQQHIFDFGTNLPVMESYFFNGEITSQIITISTLGEFHLPEDTEIITPERLRKWADELEQEIEISGDKL